MWGIIGIMIAMLTGTIAENQNNAVILNVGDVGYRVYIGKNTFSSLQNAKENETVTFWTHLAVRETSLDIYGFLDKKEVTFFEMLISISGIGPKSALAILNIADVPTLITAVSTKDSSYLTKVSGIGKKNAEKIILELENKLGSLEGDDQTEHMKEDMETLEALQALGYDTKEAREVLKKIPSETKNTSERVREALKILSS